MRHTASIRGARSDAAVAGRHQHDRDEAQGSASDAPIACEVIESFDGLDHLRPLWDEAVLQSGGSIYMTYDWVRTWWDFYGGSAALRLFVFFSGGHVAAVLPLYIDTLGVGPVRLRVARLVGANIPPKVFDPPVPEWCASDVYRNVMARIFGADDCDLLSVGPLSEAHQSRRGLETACGRPGGPVGPCRVTKGVHSVFHLPGNMDEYYGALSQNERKQRRKYDLRLLRKEYDTRVDVVSDPALVAEEFERFAEQHSQQWFAEGRTGHFGAWPRALEFNRALANAQGTLGRLRFIRIVADGQVIANQYAFAFGDRYWWELPARAVEPKWDRFSLGPTGIVTMIAHGIAEGMTRVEGGLAHYDYKLRLGAKEHETLTFRIAASRLGSRVRLACFCLLRDGVRLGYHKVWYRRIMPRLPPRCWRAQASASLRLDF